MTQQPYTTHGRNSCWELIGTCFALQVFINMLFQNNVIDSQLPLLRHGLVCPSPCCAAATVFTYKCDGPLPASGSFLAVLTAQNPSSDGTFFCGEAATATVTANGAPTFDIGAVAAGPFCAANGTAPVSFTVASSAAPNDTVATNWNLELESSVTNITCSGPTVDDGTVVGECQQRRDVSASLIALPDV